MQHRSQPTVEIASCGWATVTLALLAVSLLLAPAVQASPDPAHFPIPDNLRPNIAFWIDVYSRYNSDQAILHDEWHLDLIYEVVELGDLEEIADDEDELRRLRRRRIDDVRDRITDDLHALARSDASTPERRRLQQLWASVDGGNGKYNDAARHVRMQIGLRDRFAEAIVRSGLYMPGIERTLAEQGVPLEISRLPFVESMFVSEARSKVNAGGAWQFMLGTARLYLQMSSAVDSRIDPILAGAGAATMLRHDYEELGTWPLALTAYNHGRAGVARAVRTVGSTDLGAIVDGYRSRRFGFASRNFYAEFIAAVQVYEDRLVLFPNVEPAPELQFDEFAMTRYVSLLDLSTAADTSVEQLRILNPALDEDVFSGTLLVPRAYPLRVPAGSRAEFETAYASIPDSRKRTSQLQVGYRVRAGDTLGRIAARFGVSVGDIQRANRLVRPDRIYVNQYLRIPGQDLGFATLARADVDPGSTSHRVARGETLSSIAWRYGRKVDEIVIANGLGSPDLLTVGQMLQIPAAGGERLASTQRERGRHVVRRGENLTLIANRYGVSLDALRRHNRLTSNVIHPGQELLIP